MNYLKPGEHNELCFSHAFFLSYTMISYCITVQQLSLYTRCIPKHMKFHKMIVMHIPFHTQYFPIMYTLHTIIPDNSFP